MLLLLIKDLKLGIDESDYNGHLSNSSYAKVRQYFVPPPLCLLLCLDS